MRRPKAYLASQLGFSSTGRYAIDSLIKPRIEEIGIIVYDPFLECAKELDSGYLATLTTYEEVRGYWEDFSAKVTPINNRLMEQSDCLLAVLDGGHVVDDGVASEIGYYAGIRRGPIIAVRTDFRGGENVAMSVNPQLWGYIRQSGGELVTGQDCLGNWFAAIATWYTNFNKY